MKVIIDTNILISAAFRDRDPEAVVFYILKQPEIEWVVTKEILQEYLEVLARPKFHLSPDEFEEWSTLITFSTVLFDLPEEISFPRDPKDAKFLACALGSQADYFITGDRDFSDAPDLSPTKMVTVSQFKAQFID